MRGAKKCKFTEAKRAQRRIASSCGRELTFSYDRKAGAIFLNFRAYTALARAIFTYPPSNYVCVECTPTCVQARSTADEKLPPLMLTQNVTFGCYLINSSFRRAAKPRRNLPRRLFYVATRPAGVAKALPDETVAAHFSSHILDTIIYYNYSKMYCDAGKQGKRERQI